MKGLTALQAVTDVHGAVSGGTPAAPTSKATGTQRPEAQQDGRGGSSPSGVFGDPLSSPRPSCTHRFVLPTPAPGLFVVDGVCRHCGGTKAQRLYPEQDYWGVKGKQKPLTLRGSRHR